MLADAWYLAHALIAAESIGAVQTCLDVSVAYAKERFTFGRAIGSYQAIKHELTEVLRRLENARGLQYYAGWARESRPEEFPLAASAARARPGRRSTSPPASMINVHGGIGATWEHDAPLFFRRAQLSRRLLGGTHDATDRVAEQTLAGVAVSRLLAVASGDRGWRCASWSRRRCCGVWCPVRPRGAATRSGAARAAAALAWWQPPRAADLVLAAPGPAADRAGRGRPTSTASTRTRRRRSRACTPPAST